MPADPWQDVDGASVLAVAAALQLDPKNVPSLLRLERLAARAARTPSRAPRPNLSSSAVKRLLTSPEVWSDLAEMNEDDYEGVWIREVGFHRGPFLAVQGMASDCASVAETFLEAIFKAPEYAFPEEFVRNARMLASFLLRLGDRICERAGLRRGDGPTSEERRVDVPSAARLAEMSAWVRFTPEEMFEDLPSTAVAFLRGLLVRRSEQLAPVTDDLIDEAIVITPILETDVDLVVASPGELLASLRHHLVLEAERLECLDTLVAGLAFVAAARVEHELAGTTEHGFETVETELPLNVVHLRGRFDVDKSLEIMVVVDDLTDYNARAAYGIWEGGWETSEAIEEAFGALETDPERTLRIVTYHGLGRDAAFGIPAKDDGGPRLFLSIADLEDIVRNPGSDALTLWYFARAFRRLSKRTEILSFSTFDTFAVYSERRDSFYLGDGQLPDWVQFAVGTGQTMRAANRARVDQRGLHPPRSRATFPAMRAHGASSPIYLVSSRPPSYFVDAEIPIWVLIRRGSGETSAASILNLAESTAYWLWQLVAAGFPVPDPPAGVIVHVTTVDAAGRERWVSAHQAGGEVVVQFSRSNEEHGRNELDRRLVEVLVHAIDDGVDALEWVERVAPLGDKAMLHLLDPSNILTWPGELPDAVYLRDAAVAELLDELGDHLTGESGRAPGEIDRDDRTRFLNEEVTGWLIDRLFAAVARFDSRDLIERLLLLYEALTVDVARGRRDLPARLACFGPVDDEVDKMARRQSKAANTSIALRFLIEVASALPESDPEREGDAISGSALDALLALAAEIVSKGMLSGAIHAALSDVEVSILESGRLGTSHETDAYYQAVNSFNAARASRSLDVRNEAEREDGTTLAEADALAVVEFGFAYTDLAAAVGRILDLGSVRAFPEIVRVARTVALRDLEAGLGWEAAQAERVLDALTLGRFAEDADAFWADLGVVAPWRFNRRRSLIRQPLVTSLENGEVFLVAGRRTLTQAPINWHAQFISGRLQAQTPEMRAALGRIRQAKGDTFEREVEVELRLLGYDEVRRRVVRIGAHRLNDVGGVDLGDIDLLAVDVDRREILVVEAKSLEVARTVTELANEVTALFHGEHSARQRLANRAAWVTHHIPQTLQELGLAPGGRWTVRKVIVVSEHLVSDHLNPGGTRAVALVDLGAHLGRR